MSPGRPDKDSAKGTGFVTSALAAPVSPAEAALRPRSSAVLACLDDYLAGRRLPLAAAATFLDDRQ